MKYLGHSLLISIMVTFSWNIKKNIYNMQRLYICIFFVNVTVMCIWKSNINSYALQHSELVGFKQAI